MIFGKYPMDINIEDCIADINFVIQDMIDDEKELSRIDLDKIENIEELLEYELHHVRELISKIKKLD